MTFTGTTITTISTPLTLPRELGSPTGRASGMSLTYMTLILNILELLTPFSLLLEIN